MYTREGIIITLELIIVIRYGVFKGPDAQLYATDYSFNGVLTSNARAQVVALDTRGVARILLYNTIQYKACTCIIIYLK